MIGLGLLLALNIGGGCLPIQSDRIVTRHLAGTVPGLESLSGDTLLGYAPSPGARRIFSIGELRRFAAAQGVNADPHTDVCFEWPMASLNKDQLSEAMRETLQSPEARIDIVETSIGKVPTGRIVFPRAGLAEPPLAGPRTPTIWKGYVQYGENRKFEVWARVLLSMAGQRVIAVEALRSGEPIRPEQIRLENSGDLPLSDNVAATLKEVLGRSPKRPIPAGAPLLRSLLAIPQEVAKGDMVRVEVRSGLARLVLDGRAESSGSRGDTVLIRNPSSGRKFTAKVDGAGQVLVLAAPHSGGKE